MTPTLQELGLDRLGIEDRLAVAQQLWDSVVADLERQPLTEAQRTELKRRMAEADANPDDCIPWEKIEAEAREDFANELMVHYQTWFGNQRKRQKSKWNGPLANRSNLYWDF